MKVWPANLDMRKVMNHPIAGRFRDVGGGDWPEDTYTFRRMREGSIVTENPNAVEMQQPEQVQESQPEPPPLPPAPPEPEPEVKAETPVAPAPKRRATSKEKKDAD
jgi:hypothetical protein